MNPLAAIFGATVATRNLLYDRGLLPLRRLAGPVISIGNLSVGGTGKTPFLILLGELLKKRGICFDVLSRGYRRETSGVLEVDAAGSAARFGDEPLLIARKLGVPVVLGEERHEAGVYAERKFGPQLHLLDDGFQHRSLYRDFDIVLVTADDARDRILPAGRLREPLSALSRADAVVLTAEATADSFPVTGKLVWRVHRGIAPAHVSSRPVAFCGIARPQSFLMQLRTAGIQPAAEATFQDHHRYTEKDMNDLLNLKDRSEADGFVTTEKDAINLGEHLYRLVSLSVVPVRMDLLDANNAVDTMLRTVEERRRKHEKIVNAI
ncbi:MAG TPA: tetraacyldisaccharide 4'-kinase [Terriglobales bacterium]|nr:tetraacyldisaccharide 4'-kinase [Terriglobales bacterium]